MLDAFIVDQLKKAEEKSWIEEQPVLQIPCEEIEIPKKSKKSEEERGVLTIQF